MLTTFSIVAKDTLSGKIAVGGGSHWFAYGTLVPWLRPGVGAVATQAETNIRYGVNGLNLLEKGNDVKDAIEQLTATDSNKDIRQLLTIDFKGNTGVFTGKNCIKYAMQYSKENLAIAGNMLANEHVIKEMVDFYVANANLEFELRIIKTLQHGQGVGGDIRGKRSAALLVADDKAIVLNLRIDDHLEPFNELERQYKVALAYKEMNLGDEQAYEHQNSSEASKHYEKAYQLMPDNDEIVFWHAKLLFDLDRKDEAATLLASIVIKNPMWKEYWDRVVNNV